jgi:hypothetical protein
MPKMTLLEITQDILNDMDSDEVNSIDDTVESSQVAQIVKSSYFELISNRNWPHTRKLMQMESLADINKPNYLKIPSSVKELIFFKYDKISTAVPKISLEELRYKEPDDFLRYVSVRDSTLSNITTVTDFSGSKLLIVNDKAPTYWTAFDDSYLITDSYDSSIESTLQSSKTQCLVYYEPAWNSVDDFIPDLPTEAFSNLLEEAKSTAFVKMKQVADQKAEQKAGRQARWLARKAWRAKGGIQYEDYGRKGRK